MRNLFSFRLNGVKGNYFCGELYHVSVLLAILCLSVLPQALLYSCSFCVPIFPRNIGNQDDITSFLIITVRNLFSFRFNGRKSNYFCGESSYVSVLVTGDDNPNKACFGRTTKFLREYGNFAGNREARKTFRET